jgi:hypothetical protein
MELLVLDRKQETRLNMYGVVIMRCDNNEVIVNTNLAFKNGFADFKVIAGNIATQAQAAGAVITGIAMDKGVSAADLCALAARNAGLIYAYAAKTGNNTLRQAVDFSKSDLQRLKDAELAPVCQNIHDAGVANLAALGDYGVTAAKLAEFQTAINGYLAQIAAPRDAIVDRKVTKANIVELFKQGDFILREVLDKLIEDFADDNPDFVKQYKSARIIIDPKSKSKDDDDDNNGGGNNNPPA